MKRIICILVALVVSTISVFAKLDIAPGEWKTVRSYSGISHIIPSKHKVYVVAKGGLYYYDKDTKDVSPLSTLEGLSPSPISMVEYVRATNTLFIIHSDMTIDLVVDGVTINDESIKESDISGKNVNDLKVEGDLVYISLNAGIIVYNTRKREVLDTYIIGNGGEYEAVYQTAILNGDIYALMADVSSCLGKKLKICKKGDNANDYKSWKGVPLPISCPLDSPFEAKQMVSVFGQIVLLTNRGMFARLEDGGWVNVSPKGITPDAIQVYKGKLTAVTSDQLMIFHKNNLGDIKYRDCEANMAVYDVESDVVWLDQNGLRVAELSENEDTVTMSDPIVLSGPSQNEYFSIQLIDGEIYLTGNHDYRTPAVGDYCRDGQWHYLTDIVKRDTAGMMLKDDYRFSCAYRMLVDPLDKDHIFMPTWWGLHEFYNDTLVKIYDRWNSIIKGPISISNTSNTKAECAWYDDEHNLFITNPKSQSNLIYVMDTSGVWHELDHPKFLAQPSARFHLRTKSGIDFIVAEYSPCGICIVDMNKTPLNDRDDKTKQISSFKYMVDGIEEEFKPVYIYSVEEDLKGDIWIATDQGPIIMKNVKGVFDNKEVYVRPKIVREDDSRFADYLLVADKVRKIQIDGKNRKWIATEDNGVFLVSPTGDKIIENFTTKNSPLSSNTVMDIVYDKNTGVIYIMTDTGIFMYATDSTYPENSYNDVVVYPNPVRSDYDGDVEIKGLMDESNVRITDQRGMVIENGKSNGGTYRFSARRSDGTRLPTGIYNIFVTTESNGDAEIETKHLKFAIIR